MTRYLLILNYSLTHASLKNGKMMNNRTKKKSSGTSWRADGDSCKSGCETGQEMRQEGTRRSIYCVCFLFYCMQRGQREGHLYLTK